jgi:hypothetical protein
MLGKLFDLATGKTDIGSIIEEKLGDIVDYQAELYNVSNDNVIIQIVKNLKNEVEIVVWTEDIYRGKLTREQIEEIVKKK